MVWVREVRLNRARFKALTLVLLKLESWRMIGFFRCVSSYQYQWKMVLNFVGPAVKIT